MRFGSTRALGTAALATLLLSACYAQTPVARGAAPTPGAHVVAQLTDTGSAEMTRLLGPGVTTVEGKVGTAPADSLEILVSSTQQRGGELTLWKGEAVRFPRSALSSIYERRLSRGRSLALAGSIVAGAAILGRAFGIGTTSDPPGGGGPGPAAVGPARTYAPAPKRPFRWNGRFAFVGEKSLSYVVRLLPSPGA